MAVLTIICDRRKIKMIADQKIKSIGKQLKELNRINENMEHVSKFEDEISLKRYANDFVTKCEKLTCYSRKLAFDIFEEDRDIFVRDAAENLEIKVEKNDEIARIEIPFLLPKKNHKNTKFICDPLCFVLEKMSQNVELKTEENAVVCFVYVYEKTDKKISPKDYDNVETKRVLDIIALFMLKDDGPQYCDVFHTMEFGEKAKTLIYVMPKKRFIGWNYDRGKAG